MLNETDAAARSRLASSDAAFRMRHGSQAAASAAMSRFLSIESVISELPWIMMLINVTVGESQNAPLRFSAGVKEGKVWCKW